MNLDNLKELIKKSLQQEETTNIDTGFLRQSGLWRRR